MTTTTETSTTGATRWTRAWHWLRSFDEALHHDETARLRATVARLNQRIARLEAKP
jgi:ubiquinone biosynthesis protein UbiJ